LYLVNVQKKEGCRKTDSDNLLTVISSLLAKVEGLHKISVSLDVRLLKVIQDAAPLADEHLEGTLCVVVLLVLLQMLGKVVDTVGK
jgi:hypothetical protein